MFRIVEQNNGKQDTLSHIKSDCVDISVKGLHAIIYLAIAEALEIFNENSFQHVQVVDQHCRLTTDKCTATSEHTIERFERMKHCLLKHYLSLNGIL